MPFKSSVTIFALSQANRKGVKNREKADFLGQCCYFCDNMLCEAIISACAIKVRLDVFKLFHALRQTNILHAIYCNYKRQNNNI